MNEKKQPRKKKTEITIRSSAAEFLTFIAASDGDKHSYELRYEDENIWLTQSVMAELYSVKVPTINYHIKKTISDGEIIREATIRKYLIVQNEGGRDVSREVKYYNLQR